MDAFGIFQGGGLKGFAHIGALQASDQRGIRFLGLAGTSAGAIVAALAAAGYTGDELFHWIGSTESGTMVFDLVDVLDSSEEKSVRRLLKTLGRLRKRRSPVLDRLGGLLVVKWAAQPFVYLRHVTLFRRLRRDNGAVAMDRFIVWLDRALRAKLELPPDVSRVRFRDLKLPLKCVAANLTAENARVFGGKEDENMPVADAVAASACFPLFFKPVCLEDGEYVDGGLMSNLPAWVFDAERERQDEVVPTLGFKLPSPPPTSLSSLAPLAAFLGRLLRTTLAAAGNLEERRIDGYYAVDLRANASTLAFHELTLRRADLIDAGREDALAFLNREIGPRDPKEMEEVLGVMSNAVKMDLNTAALVRAYVLMPNADGRTARSLYSANTEDDADGRATLDIGASGPARCFRVKEPLMARTTRPQPVGRTMAERHERAIRRETVAWVYALPIFADGGHWENPIPEQRPAPIAVLCFDCDEDVADRLLSMDVEDRFASYAQLFGEHLRQREMKPGPGKTGGRGSPASTWVPVANAEMLFSSDRVVRCLTFDESMAQMVKRAEGKVNRLRERRKLANTDEGRV